MPDSMSKERIRILEAYGAKVVLTPGEKNMGGANEKAAEILEQTENAIITGQGGNPSNPGSTLSDNRSGDMERYR